MYISKFRLHNYKSFLDSGEIEFGEGINLIVGQNNSGKTALLENLNLTVINNPHVSIQTLPRSSSKILQNSNFEIEIVLSKQEVKNFLLLQNSEKLGVVLEKSIFNWQDSLEIEGFELEIFAETVQSCVNKFNQWLKNENPAVIKINNNRYQSFFKLNKEENFGLYSPENPDSSDQYTYAKIHQTENGLYEPIFHYDVVCDDEGNFLEENIVEVESYKDTAWNCLYLNLYGYFKSKIYRFYAERLNIGNCTYGQSEFLKPNASNLPEVLYNLQTNNPPLFEKYYNYVRSIIPTIERVSVAHQDSSPNHRELTIFTWSKQASENALRELAIPLSDCGTGISQVLAIVYVVFTSEEGKSIIIDEPSSFLHPSASRKLIEFLKLFPQHQYFISTHSPTIINSALPCNVIQVKQKNGQSKAFTIDPKASDSILDIYNELGVRLSDVFGADNILWVEGETEEKCFPLILKKIKGKSLRGTAIIKVFETGYFDSYLKTNKKDKMVLVRKLIELYEKVSNQESLFPPMLAFVLDREDRNLDELEKIENLSPNKIKFIEERMYENYLIDAKAIAAIINQLDTSKTEEIDISELENYIQENFIEIEKNASEFLNNLFLKFTNKRVDYKSYKPARALKLTEWILENNPSNLSEIANFLDSILNNNL
jgi:AAA15 family ATPase/GTPase